MPSRARPLLASARAALAAAAIAACMPAVPTSPAASGSPQRVVSLDYCADQFVLKLADRGQIAALSPDAEKPFSFMRRAARGIPQARPTAEDALARRPDLVVRAYGGGAGLSAFLAQSGVPIAQLGFVDDLDGVRANVRLVAEALGRPERGEALIAEMDRRLAAAAKSGGSHPRALYMAEGGVAAGPGSLVHELFLAAGLRNYIDAPGWPAIPLETLVYQEPDLIAAAFFDGGPGQDAWSASRHPVAQAALAARPNVKLKSAWTACGGWFVVEAVEALAAKRAEFAQ